MLVVGENSYVTVAEADTYFGDRWGSDSWAILTEENKESLLISACSQQTYYCSWAGDPTDTEQDLPFPRNGDTEVPQPIKDAQCEIAINMLASGSFNQSSANSLTKLKAGSVELNWHDSASTTNSIFSDYSSKLMAPYCDDNISGGSCNKVVRT